MNIDFSKKELKSGVLTASNIQMCYLLAIRLKHPQIWEQMKDAIRQVEAM